ncbi:MAG: hypothetical protein DI598_06420 [Pseudopedobacter saltans]|uniref:Helix-hairpin-helix domain-containing protein n=1 Tax=Pseudopedobacter saltans TaxID=151895 RepID=A0A2W5H356_9SPHI|nr:MAG: hypothetical protein DI598_06420 [Pseudopedobacter saltans]
MENKGIKGWLSFSRKERSALLILIVSVALFFLVPYIFPKKQKELTVAEDVMGAKTLIEGKPSDALFSFDPNTIDSVGFKKLGLRDKTIMTILHYREKGGRFKKAEDIRKIYGLRKEEADKLIPYIQIGSYNVTSTTRSVPTFNGKQYSFPLEVNSAGVDHWAALPGISLALAQRVVHYRDAIHGFKSIEQIGKTYGLSPQVFDKIKPLLRLTPEITTNIASTDHVSITEKQTVATIENKIPVSEKFNINTASEQDLLSQKRIPRSVAKAIVIYREQHGLYQQVADIKKIVFVNEELFARVEPYLKVE